MTKKEKNILEKVYNIEYPLNKTHYYKNLNAKDLKSNYEDFVLNFHNNIIKSLNKVIKSPNYSILFNKEKTKIDIFKTNSQNIDFLISTISIANFPKNLLETTPPTSSIRVHHLHSNTPTNLEKEKLDIFKVWFSINEYLLNNELKILSKLESHFIKHHKIGVKLDNKAKKFQNKISFYHQKKTNLFLSDFLKDIYQEGVKFSWPLPNPIFFSKKIGIKNLYGIKHYKDNIFIATTYDLASEVSREIEVEIDNPKGFFKINLNYILEYIILPSSYTLLIRGARFKALTQIVKEFNLPHEVKY